MATAKQYSAAGNLILPNTFQHPNFFVDKLMYLLEPEENTVLTFAVRRILGFQENISSRRDHISLSQFTDGITARNGEKLCYGCGLSASGVRTALDALEKHRILLPTSDKPDPRKGQEYWLQENPDCIDWQGLQNRLNETKARDAARTQKARSSVRQNNEKLSVTQNNEPSVTQNLSALSDRNTKPSETHENNNGAQTAPDVIDPASLPLDWQIKAVTDGKMEPSQITPPGMETTFMGEVELSVFQLFQKGAPHLEGLHRAFMLARRIVPSNSKQLNSWRVAYQQMYDAKMNRVQPEHVTQAVQKLALASMTIKDPFSIIGTAIALANPIETHDENERLAAEVYGE